MTRVYAFVLSSGIVLAADPAPGLESLLEGLTFHCSFDASPDADFARGDRRIHTAEKGNPVDGKPGLFRDDVAVEKTGGRYGGALRFAKKNEVLIFYRGEKNIDYDEKNWNGSVSFWLSLDPEKDLEPGYCDPIQITDKAWNKAALWVDFSKDPPRDFRLGAFADFAAWNPRGKKYDEIPESERPMVTVKKPPFRRGKWTHVVFTFSGFNRDGTGGVAELYLDGKLQGAVKGRRQIFTWNPEKVAIKLGISYIGLFDDLAVFNRPLSDKEVKALHALPGGIAALRRGK